MAHVRVRQPAARRFTAAKADSEPLGLSAIRVFTTPPATDHSLKGVQRYMLPPPRATAERLS